MKDYGSKTKGKAVRGGNEEQVEISILREGLNEQRTRGGGRNT